MIVGSTAVGVPGFFFFFSHFCFLSLLAIFFYFGSSILAMKIAARAAYLFLLSVEWIYSFGPGSLLLPLRSPTS